MKAAERLFTSRQYHQITTDDIARDAHVGKGTIYRHFADKEDLFWQIATSGFDEMCALVEKRVRQELPFEQRVRSAAGAISDFFASRRQLFRMMQSEESRTPWLRGRMRQSWCERRQRLVGAVAAILEQGVRDGRLRDDLPIDVLANLLMGMLRTRARDLAEHNGSDCNIDQIVAFFLRGAAPSTRVD